MYVYDIMANQVTEMNIYDIAEMLGRTPSNVSKSAQRGAIVKNLNIVIFKNEPTVEERRAKYSEIKLHNEVWHVMKGSDGQFKISNYGRFKRVYKKHQKFLLPFLHRQKGEMYVKVRFNSVYKQYRVKDLVAAHFLREPKPNEVLYFSNGIKTDCYAGNLKWIDRSKLAKKTGGLSRSKEVVQLDPDTLEVIAEYRSTRETARKTPYSYQSISDYCNGKRENQYGHLFMWRDEYEKLYGEVV
ncbi:MAG: hypothetical protein GX072_03655 [Lysinibacillus sp.]|nr:hypothetical protein [Lysinibacillus sp.]